MNSDTPILNVLRDAKGFANGDLGHTHIVRGKPSSMAPPLGNLGANSGGGGRSASPPSADPRSTNSTHLFSNSPRQMMTTLQIIPNNTTASASTGTGNVVTTPRIHNTKGGSGLSPSHQNSSNNNNNNGTTSPSSTSSLQMPALTPRSQQLNLNGNANTNPVIPRRQSNGPSSESFTLPPISPRQSTTTPRNN